MNTFLRRLQIEEIACLHSAFLSAVFDPPTLSDLQAAEHPAFQRIRDQLKPQRVMLAGGVAILPVHGALARKPDPFEMLFYGVEDSTAVLQMIQDAARDPEVLGAVLDVDSPGGMVTGGLEVSDAVAAMESVKPVVAWSGGLMASMGYHIGARAGTVTASRSAQIGSIGTVISWLDVTERMKAMGLSPVTFVSKDADLKRAGAPGSPLTDEQKAYFQARVDGAAAEFHRAVEEKRGKLSAEAKRGGMHFAEDAKKIGLVDSVGPREWAIDLLKRQIKSRTKG